MCFAIFYLYRPIKQAVKSDAIFVQQRVQFVFLPLFQLMTKEVHIFSLFPGLTLARGNSA